MDGLLVVVVYLVDGRYKTLKKHGHLSNNCAEVFELRRFFCIFAQEIIYALVKIFIMTESQIVICGTPCCMIDIKSGCVAIEALEEV